MGYDRGDSFPFDFEPNGILFGSKLKGKLSPRSYPIPFERNWEYSFLSVRQLCFGFYHQLALFFYIRIKAVFLAEKNNI